MNAVIALLSCVVATGGCAEFDCTQIETFPIEITPVDAVSGAGIADSATATAALGDGSWPFGPHLLDTTLRPVTLWGGGGPGLYRVAVRHPRYVPWDTAGVLVSAKAGCERFVAVTITVRMTER